MLRNQATIKKQMSFLSSNNSVITEELQSVGSHAFCKGSPRQFQMGMGQKKPNKFLKLNTLRKNVNVRFGQPKEQQGENSAANDVAGPNIVQRALTIHRDKKAVGFAKQTTFAGSDFSLENITELEGSVKDELESQITKENGMQQSQKMKMSSSAVNAQGS